jgi:hypothetical protein
MIVTRAALASAARSYPVRTVAACVGVIAVVGLLYYTNFTIFDTQRQLVDGTDIAVCHLLAGLATAPMVAALLFASYGNALSRSQPRGMSIGQILGFMLITLFFMAVWGALTIGASQYPEMIW